jgi:hypothetical protein
MKHIKADAVVEANPKRPYKLIAAMVSAFLTSLIASNMPQPPLAIALETGVVAALTVFLIPNPLRWRDGVPASRENQETLF